MPITMTMTTSMRNMATMTNTETSRAITKGMKDTKRALCISTRRSFRG